MGPSLLAGVTETLACWGNTTTRFTLAGCRFGGFRPVLSKEMARDAASPWRPATAGPARAARESGRSRRSEEHTSELQSLMRISYAVFCLKKKKQTNKSNETI